MEDIALACIAVGCGLKVKSKKRSSNRKVWTKDWLLKRNDKGLYSNLIQEMRLADQESFRRFLRMNTDTFEKLLERVKPVLEKKPTKMRMPISVEIKLAITLRFLATGESYASLQHPFRVHESTISKFVPEVCDAIYESLKDEYLRCPSTPEEWETLSNNTYERWQFPNAFAAADGKHVAIYHPFASGSEYYNYKGFNSVVLMAFVDYDYKFLYIDVGCQGRISDGGVFRNTSFCHYLKNGKLNLPSPRSLPIVNTREYPDYEPQTLPFVFVGDNAFPLSENCMKPYPDRGLNEIRRIFNYRLSRFRRVTENAFGILVNRFRIFSGKINLSPEKATKVVLAAVVLHNILRTLSADSYTPHGFADQIQDDIVIDGTWRRNNAAHSSLYSLRPSHGNNTKKAAEKIRDSFADYFYGPGAVEWQWKTLM